jgi:exonuclease SbcC
LQELFQHGQAAILAGSLQDGQPCPVCGALEHPCPAVSEDIIPTQAEIDAKQSGLEKLQQAAAAASERYMQQEKSCAALKAQLDKIEESLAGAAYAAEDLPAQIEQQQMSLRTAEKAGKELPAIRQAVQQSAKAAATYQAKLQENQQQRLAAGKELADRSGRLAEKRASLPVGGSDRLGIEKILQGKEGQLQQLEQAWQTAEKVRNERQQQKAAAESFSQAAKAAASEAAAQAAAAAQAFTMRREAAGFATEAIYGEALAGRFAEEDYRAEVRKHLQDFTVRYRAEQTAQTTAAAAVAEAGPCPDIKALNGRVSQSTTAVEECLGIVKQLETQLQQERQTIAKLEGYEKESRALETKHETIGRLAEVANGSQEGITFERYVLRALLWDVIDAANQRLRVMSQGQYRFQSGDRARKNAAGGLDLEIFDEYGGAARNMATLSGGESFLASLSLALGLADVVQAYAGGIRLDTIFIDEGFGSLDTETLDVALKALLNLQKGGRLVGIISHVEELQERIDARLEVTKTRDGGSTARFVL